MQDYGANPLCQMEGSGSFKAVRRSPRELRIQLRVL